MSNNRTNTKNKYEIHAAELAAAVKAERQAEDKHVEAEARLGDVLGRLRKGDDSVTVAEYMEARAAAEMAEMIAKAKAHAVKVLKANAPWDPVLAEQLAQILRKGLPGLDIVVMDKEPVGFKAEVPTLVVYQRERARIRAGSAGCYEGSVKGKVFGPEYMRGMFAIERTRLERLLKDARRARFQLDPAGMGSSELYFRAVAVWDELPRFGRGPSDEDAKMAVEDFGRSVISRTALPGRTEVANVNGHRYVVPVSRVRTKPLGAEIKGSKAAAGKRVTTAVLYLDAWPNPNFEVDHTHARNAVEREAEALIGSVVSGIGRITEAKVGLGSAPGDCRQVYAVTITGEAAA